MSVKYNIRLTVYHVRRMINLLLYISIDKFKLDGHTVIVVTFANECPGETYFSLFSKYFNIPTDAYEVIKTFLVAPQCIIVYKM